MSQEGRLCYSSASSKTVTFYHQYQRQIQYNQDTKEPYIETTKEDIEIAFRLMKHVLFSKSDELSKATRNFGEPER
ncbi:MAG: hypothetical protein IPO37_25585 [Saprospiraceae bacterium]|nr:hypothetical protein [Saprospiraceae bacterium]